MNIFLPPPLTTSNQVKTEQVQPKQAQPEQPKPPKQMVPIETRAKPFDTSAHEDVPANTGEIAIPKGIPLALADLMKINKVSEEDVRFVVSQKGYYPENTPITNYDENFIKGVLIGAWEQVYGMIKENKEIPF